jgi:CDP-diacylglycerol pyrophosphatase
MPDSETKSEARSKFLGDPPLTRRDSKEDYNALHEQVERHIKPEGFLDDLTVRELTDAIWEGQRYKRYQSNLIEGAFHAALIQTLTRIFQTDEWSARAEATKWYSDDVEEQRSVLTLLSRFGISVETLYAMAMSSNAAPITVLERMISNRKSSRSKLLKDHDQLLRRIEKIEYLPGEIIEV